MGDTEYIKNNVSYYGNLDLSILGRTVKVQQVSGPVIYMERY